MNDWSIDQTLRWTESLELPMKIALDAVKAAFIEEDVDGEELVDSMSAKRLVKMLVRSGGLSLKAATEVGQTVLRQRDEALDWEQAEAAADQETGTDSTPAHFKCGITLEVMSDPVCTELGQSYERR